MKGSLGRGAAAVLAVCVMLAAPPPATARERIGHLDVEVLVPPGYDDDAARRWPVVYVVPGSGGTAESAARDLELDDWSGRADAIVAVVWEPYVTKEGDPVGWNFLVDYHDGSKPLDTEFAEQVVPWVDAHYRTLLERRQRAIVGYSAGGYSAAAIASRHPDLFGAMGAFSGVVDITDRHPLGEWAVLAPFLLDAPQVTLFRPWGNPVTDIANWHAQNPAEMAGRLRDVDAVYIAAGDGTPADAAEAQEDAGNLVVPQAEAEEQISSMTRSYDRRLTAAGVRHVYRPHRGTHSARHWHEDLRTFWPLAAAAFGSG